MADLARGKQIFNNRVEHPLTTQSGVQDYIFNFVPTDAGSGREAKHMALNDEHSLMHFFNTTSNATFVHWKISSTAANYNLPDNNEFNQSGKSSLLPMELVSNCCFHD